MSLRIAAPNTLVRRNLRIHRAACLDVRDLAQRNAFPVCPMVFYPNAKFRNYSRTRPRVPRPLARALAFSGWIKKGFWPLITLFQN